MLPDQTHRAASAPEAAEPGLANRPGLAKSPGMRSGSAALGGVLLSAAAFAEPSAVPSQSEGAAPAAVAAPAPAPSRIYSRGYTTYVWVEPRKRGQKLGYVRVGTSVALRSTEPVVGEGCAAGFYPVKPYGFVCLDATSTLDAGERYVRGLALAVPSDAMLPFRFALSNGTPMYTRLPSRAEWEPRERFLGAPGTHAKLSWGNRGHEQLAGASPGEPSAAVPFFLADGGSMSSEKPLGLVRRHIPNGSMLAYTSSFEHEGRTFLLSTDGTVVPADRVRGFRESSFEGVELGSGLELPLVWIRKQPAPKLRRAADGSLAETGESWPLRGHVALDPGAALVEDDGRSYLVTAERDAQGEPLFIAEAKATLVRPRDTLPIGVTEDDKWVHVSITKGALVAYEGRRAVFATLVSPGAGGVPMRGKDPVKMSTTPLGVFRVTYKHRAATMSPEKGENRKFWIADVPYTQYFDAPFALHTAYWHENFGEGMSAGCVNLSPRDGRRLFGWTDPKVPEGWNGAGAGGVNGKGTFVVIER